MSCSPETRYTELHCIDNASIFVTLLGWADWKFCRQQIWLHNFQKCNVKQNAFRAFLEPFPKELLLENLPQPSQEHTSPHQDPYRWDKPRQTYFKSTLLGAHRVVVVWGVFFFLRVFILFLVFLYAVSIAILRGSLASLGGLIGFQQEMGMPSLSS